MNAKEIAVNTLIGSLLVSAIVAPILAIGFGVYGLSLAAKHFLPSVSGDVWSFALLCFVSISVGVGHIRKRLWFNALLSLSIIAVGFPASFLSSNRVNSLWLMPTSGLFLLFLIPLDRRLRGWESWLAGALALAGIVLNAGILSATPAKVVGACWILTVLTWIVAQLRRGQFAGLSFTNLSQTNT